MHLHYSPFQFATAVEVSEGDVNAHNVVKVLKSLTKKDTSKTHNMGSTMSCADAAKIPGSPNAFISPNPIGAMKDIKMPMASTGIAPAPKGVQHYDESYRHRSRVGYGDRKLDERLMAHNAHY